MEFTILGRTRLYVDGSPVEIGASKQRALLTLLLVQVGRPVPVELVVDQLWPGRSRDEVREILYSLVSRLRTVFKRAGVPGEIRSDTKAYLLALDPRFIDHHRFRRQVEAARAAAHAGDHVVATNLLRDAIDAWRGPPLIDLGTEWAEQRRRQMIENDLLPAQYALIDSTLALGEYGAALDLLGPLADDHPLDETLAMQRIRALDGLGRIAEVTSFYARFRQNVLAGYGVEPGQQVREAYQRALSRRTLGGDQHTSTDGPGAWPGQPPPWQLPRVATNITGRNDLLAALDALLLHADEGQPAPAVALHGMPGVGKTTLATAWGWLRRDRYPDGGLFLNFYGYLPEQCLSADDAMARFLEAVGVPPDRIPDAGAQRADLLNRLLAGRRMLVVLDNVRDPAHVRPLLAAISTCPVLVTSRTMPTGLVRDGVRSVLVPTLPADDSIALLRVEAPSGCDDDPASVEALAALSGGLPLALKLIGQYAANRPRMGLADIARQLDSYAALLRATGDDDEWDSLQGAFLLSFNSLPPAAAELFLLLGLQPLPSFGRDAAAALCGKELGETERLLAILAQSHLLEPESWHRYRCHELLHAYSTTRAHEQLHTEQRHSAVESLVDFYLRSAVNAWCRLYPYGDPVPPMTTTTDVAPVSFETEEEALAWSTTERSNLIAATRLAAEYELHEYAWRIPAVIADIFERSGYHDDVLASVRVAIRSARTIGNLKGETGLLNFLGGYYYLKHDYREALINFRQAMTLAERANYSEGLAASLHNVASAHLQLSDIDVAVRLYQQALELDTERGDLEGVAWCLHQLAVAHRRTGRFDQAMDHLSRALTIREKIGDLRGQGDSLTELGALHHERGEYDLARHHCRLALDVHERCHDKVSATKALTVLASVFVDTGHLSEADGLTQRALDLSEITGDRLAKARALHVRGRVLAGLGGRDAALQAWKESVAILNEFGDPEAETVGALLAIG